MMQYIWFHPLYIKETLPKIVFGQMENSRKNGYIVLQENELGHVRASDHLTLVGHSTPPKKPHEPTADDEDSDFDDMGGYIQGDTAEECVARLKKEGLKHPPQILSLECCNAAIKDGIAQKLSSHPFFINTIIEANTSGIGRNPGGIKWSMTHDKYGRVIVNHKRNPWQFLLAGQIVAKHAHGTYDVKEVVTKKFQHDSQAHFLPPYSPGLFVAQKIDDNEKRIRLDQTISTELDQEPQTSASATAGTI